MEPLGSRLAWRTGMRKKKRAPGRAAGRARERRRPSRHVAPRGLYETAQHYVGDLVFGATDGIVTTFAVVSGATGGALSSRTVVIVGVANLLADGLSMGVGNYLSIRARESALRKRQLPEEEAYPARHGCATFLAFVLAGAAPLVPYLAPIHADRFVLAGIMGLAALFGVGAARSFVTAGRWWSNGLETLVLGAAAAAVAYAAGAGLAAVLQGGAGTRTQA